MSTTYSGFRVDGKCLIRVDAPGARLRSLALHKSLKVWNHSPTGFEWGYGGSGPAQTALAILLDFTGNSDLASELHQDFKRDFVASWPREGWQITGEQIAAWMENQKAVNEQHRGN